MRSLIDQFIFLIRPAGRLSERVTLFCVCIFSRGRFFYGACIVERRIANWPALSQRLFARSSENVKQIEPDLCTAAKGKG